MEENDSIYRLFSNLSEFIKDNKIELKKNQKDESSAFSQAMEGVKEIHQNKNIIKKKIHAKHLPTKNDAKKQLEEAVADHHNFNVTNLPEYMEGYIEDINPITMEKLRSGEFSIQKVLDLHGYVIEEADKLFQDFIKEAIKSRLNCIKVIHGRGLKSKEEPVLKEMLKEWIIRAMHRKWVIAFSSSKMCDGGPGATYILLKKKPEKKKIHIVG
jgi:DNA-nicking Smr family endonuclease